MAEVKWIKITTSMFDDEKISLIQSIPEGDAVLVIWIRLLLLAGKVNDNGFIYLGDNLPYTEEMLATIFKKQVNIVRLALATFEQFGMIELTTKGIYLPNWEKHQNADKLEAIREYNRLAKQQEREKKKLLLKDVNDTSMTIQGCQGLESSISISNSISKEEGGMGETLKDFIEMRKKIKKPMTDRAVALLKDKLAKMGDEKTQIAILEQSIMNCWQGVFPLNRQGEKKEVKNADYSNYGEYADLVK